MPPLIACLHRDVIEENSAKSMAPEMTSRWDGGDGDAPACRILLCEVLLLGRRAGAARDGQRTQEYAPSLQNASPIGQVLYIKVTIRFLYHAPLKSRRCLRSHRARLPHQSDSSLPLSVVLFSLAYQLSSQGSHHSFCASFEGEMPPRLSLI